MSHKQVFQLETDKKTFFVLWRDKQLFSCSSVSLCCAHVSTGQMASSSKDFPSKPCLFLCTTTFLNKSDRNSWFLWSKLWGCFTSAFLFAESKDKHFAWKFQRVYTTHNTITFHCKYSRLCSIIRLSLSVDSRTLLVIFDECCLYLSTVVCYFCLCRT